MSKKILLGITGSIAAYKSVFLVRLLVSKGYEVKVVMTPAATQFVSPLTLSTLSNHPVWVHEVDAASQTWNNHIALGLWADLMIIAPATANTLAQMAHGLCDNLLLATFLSARCPVWVAPAMDLDMFTHPTTQKNLSILQQHKHLVLEPQEGFLASGLEGKGRMQEPEMILNQIQAYFAPRGAWQEIKSMITVGPTRESLDPVRFVTNHSSGKMGISLVRALLQKGAEVHLVLGPVTVPLPQHERLFVYPVITAEEMLAQALLLHSDSQLCIFNAAVADYRPEVIAEHKIKKTGDDMVVRFIKNPDIAYLLGQQKTEKQVHVGFALETQNGEEAAQSKLRKKNFDFVVLNTTQDKGAGFGHETNKITILDAMNHSHEYPLKSKDQVAEDILEYVQQNSALINV